jgi:hypothetical protein
MKKLSFIIFGLLLLSCSQKRATEALAPMFPFVISYDGPGNVTNMSHLLDAPAGKDGFVRIENGHFVTDAGRIRLNGTNLTGSANFPSHEQADLLAARLARFGINCVRLHYMDANYSNFMQGEEHGIFTNDSTTQRNLDPAQIDRLDYMIAQFKMKGIYVDINLHVARKMDERDGFPGIDQRPSLDKGVDNFEPRMVALQKEYAKKLLTHVNPYTKLAYTDDPCVALVEINNENALFNQYFGGSIDKLPEPYSLELQKQWNSWIHKNYQSAGQLSKAWGLQMDSIAKDFSNKTIPLVKRDAAYSPVRRDFYRFIYQVEKEYWTGMYTYLKKELKVKPVISGTQLRYTSPFLQADLDYIDIHSYWCHPSPVNPEWEIGNVSMVNSLKNISEMAAQRISNKPFTVSEYNHPFPNQYGAEGQPMLRAYGSMQEWDGVFEYTYNHRLDFEPQAMNYFFDMLSRTDVLAHMPACAAIYLRGDVLPAKESLVTKINHAAYFDSLAIARKVRAGIENAGYDPGICLIHKTAVELTEDPVKQTTPDSKIPDNQKIITSDTGELTWNMEKENAGYWTVNTANTKLFSGFPDGRSIDLGGVEINIGKTRLGWATLSLVSKNATGFGSSGKPADILLTATGIVENKGMVVEKSSDTKIRLTNWGTGPVLAEGIPAVIKLPSIAAKTKCFALDPHGDRKSEVAVTKFGEGGCQISIKPDYQTVWYEIVIAE